MAEILYDDTYAGPRWTYGLTYRPVSFGNLPKGWIVFSDRKHPDFRFGTIDFPRELPAHEAEQASLTLIDAQPGQEAK